MISSTMNLSVLAESLIEQGFNNDQIKQAKLKAGVNSVTVTPEQQQAILEALGVTSESTTSDTSRGSGRKQGGGLTNEPQGGLAEAPPANLGQAAQQIDAKESLANITIDDYARYIAAAKGQLEADKLEVLRLTQETAKEAATMQYELSRLQREKESLMASQPDIGIDQFLESIGMPSPSQNCSNAIALAEEAMQEIRQLQEEKKA